MFIREPKLMEGLTQSVELLKVSVNGDKIEVKFQKREILSLVSSNLAEIAISCLRAYKKHKGVENEQ